MYGVRCTMYDVGVVGTAYTAYIRIYFIQSNIVYQTSYIKHRTSNIVHRKISDIRKDCKCIFPNCSLMARDRPFPNTYINICLLTD